MHVHISTLKKASITVTVQTVRADANQAANSLIQDLTCRVRLDISVLFGCKWREAVVKWHGVQYATPEPIHMTVVEIRSIE
ncbi:hypothetical protein TNCV_4247581 [Trichonephila clavipes]|nr:hypothetical protein TNCV_4247581 [Trichonephila clavipes]